MEERKQPGYRFSGAPTFDAAALPGALAGATAVQLSRGGFLIYAVDPEADVLADDTEKYVDVRREEDGPRITDPAAIAELVEALTVSEVTDFVCMCTGDLAAEFFDEEQHLVGVVRMDLPHRIEWPHWPGLATLREPRRLERWLAAHGASLTP